MAVRFRRSGTTEIKDHNELINRGTRTHAEIDTYLAEMDAARGSHSSLKKRFDEIETKNTLQDTRLTAAESKNEAQDTRLTAIETKNTAQDDQLKSLQDSLLVLSDGQLVQNNRLDALENADVVNPLEVIDARTDKNGTVYSTLKERLDAQQGVGGGGGTALPSSGYLFQVEENTAPNKKTIAVNVPYAVGKNEIEVFRGGVRQIKDVHYIELSMLSISFEEALVPGEVVIIRRRDRDGVQSSLHLSGEYVIAVDNNKTFTLSKHFNSPYKSLEVFYNGVLLSTEEYEANPDNTVTCSFEPVIGSLLLFQVVDKKHLPDPFLLEEHQLIEQGKTTYELNTFVYEKGELEVYVQGVRWYVGIDYTEVDAITVDFISTLPPNGQISFVKENGLSKELSVNQVELLDVIATQEQPFVHVIPVPKNTDFKFFPIQALKRVSNSSTAWKAAVHGFDYDYEYPREDRLLIYLYKDGNYKINY